MDTLSQRFISTVENYLSASGMTATQFGRATMKDPNFVFGIRAGRSPSLATIDKINAWIAANPATGQAA